MQHKHLPRPLRMCHWECFHLPAVAQKYGHPITWDVYINKNPVNHRLKLPKLNWLSFFSFYPQLHCGEICPSTISPQKNILDPPKFNNFRTFGIVGRKSGQKGANGANRANWIKRSEMVWTCLKHHEMS